MGRRIISFWVQRSWWQSLGLLLCLAVPFNVTAGELLPPLLKQSKILACAQSETRAKVALSALWQIEDTQSEFPDENMRADGESTLHAATLDIVLKSLLGTAERFPSLRNQVERTLLKWNYCDVFQDGVFYDLKRTGTELNRSKSAEVSPENWQGFKALGFFGATENRFVPDILNVDQQSLRSDYEWLFHRVFREQCFPHPDTSELFDSAELKLQSNIAAPIESAASEYPHEWNAECIYPRKAPPLVTKLKLVAMPVAVPKLKSVVNLRLVPQRVPGLLTKVELTDLKVAVPSLLSTVKIQAVLQLVPNLLTTIKLSPQTIAVPSLRSQLFLDVIAVKVPTLTTKISLDKVKVVKKKSAKYIKNGGNYTGNKTGSYTGNSGGNHYIGGSQQQATHTHKATNRTQKITRKVGVAKVVSQSNKVLGKNASLLERVLSGLSGGGNVLIVDKIQLTVNEYNGTVETAISSSDIGTSVSALETKPAMVRELLQALPTTRHQSIISAANTVTKPIPVVIKTPKKEIYKKIISEPSRYIVVPELQSMLLVSQVEASRPKPVQIKRKSARIKQTKAKKRYAANKNQRTKRAKKITSSSRFSYRSSSYDQPSPKQKSVEQLLLEYQAYEDKRQRKYLPKKKLVNNESSRLLDVPELISEVYWMFWPEPDVLKRDVPTLNTELWFYKNLQSKLKVPKLKSRVQIHNTRQNKVKVPSLQSRVRIYKKYTTKTLKVPSLGTMLIIQSSAQPIEIQPSKKDPATSFEFSKERLPDEVFEKTLILERIVSPVTTPTFLSGDGPLPYVIDERFSPEAFSNGKKANGQKAKKSKIKKKTIGLAGSVYLKQSLKNSNKAIGGSINRKIIKDNYWFARVGWNYTLEESDDPFSYSWGIGYSDWHPGTFSAQLNNWGPIKPEQGLALEKAVANFGYSVKSEFLKKHKLSLSGAINIPVDGNSSISGNFRWSPIKNWYVNTSVSHPLEGDGTPKWTYGFGYSDWRPNKINLQYSNYGPNEIPYHNYEANGTWALSYNWKF